MADLKTGTIMALRSPAGSGQEPTYGFIRDEGGQDVFFHGGSLREGVLFSQLKVGQRVRFDTVMHPKGVRAIGVEIVVDNN